MTEQIALEDLQDHPDNPRLFLREEVINSIATQIKNAGFFDEYGDWQLDETQDAMQFDESHALLVRPVDGGYQIIQGHHRRAAADKAGLDSVPCWVREMTDDEAYKALVTGNVQGELTPLEIGLHILNDVELGDGGPGNKGGLSQYADKLSKSKQYMSQNYQAAKTYNVYINSVLLPSTQVDGNNTDKSLTAIKRLLSKKSKHLSEIKNLPDEAIALMVHEMLARQWSSKETASEVKKVKSLIDLIPDWWEIPSETLVYQAIDKKSTTAKQAINAAKSESQLGMVTLYHLHETDTTKEMDGREYKLWKSEGTEYDPKTPFRKAVNEFVSFPSKGDILKAKQNILEHIQLHSSPSEVWKPILTDNEWDAEQRRGKELARMSRQKLYTPELIQSDVVKALRGIMPDSIDLVCTDPPYNMDKAEWDTYSLEDFKSWCGEWMKECYRILKDTGSFYVFGRFDMLRHLSLIAEAAGFNFRREIIWDTIQGSGGPGLWPNRHETILYFSKGIDPYTDPEAVKVERHEEDIRVYKGVEYKFKSLSTVWRFPCVDDKDDDRVDHPTQKPIEVISRIIKANSPHGGRVVDPFIGSGTTGVASMQLERRCIGIDNNQDYINIAKGRFGSVEVGSGLNIS